MQPPALPCRFGDVEARGAKHIIQRGIGDPVAPSTCGISKRTAVGHIAILRFKVVCNRPDLRPPLG